MYVSVCVSLSLCVYTYKKDLNLEGRYFLLVKSYLYTHVQDYVYVAIFLYTINDSSMFCIKYFSFFLF